MQAKLIEFSEIAPNVRHFVFEALGAEKLDFIPGQFVSFTHTLNGKKITRAYSIASPPSDTNRFDLCLNLVSEGFLSPHLFAMQPGDTVEMRSPLGMFVLRTPPRDTILIATGTGIAPFRSILKAGLSENSRAFTLIFGVRHESHLMYRAEFRRDGAPLPHFRFWPTLSRPDALWSGRTGHVQKHIPDAIGDRRDVDIFLCGLKLMVDDVRTILKDMGFDRKQIFYEKYD